MSILGFGSKVNASQVHSLSNLTSVSLDFRGNHKYLKILAEEITFKMTLHKKYKIEVTSNTSEFTEISDGIYGDGETYPIFGQGVNEFVYKSKFDYTPNYELCQLYDYKYSYEKLEFYFDNNHGEFGGDDWYFMVDSSYGSVRNGYNLTISEIDEIDRDKPILSGGETNFISNYDNPTTLNEILSTIQAVDNVDGNITSKIVVESNGFYVVGGIDNRRKLGTYSVVFSVSDTAGNKAVLTVHVTVVDVTNPVITGTLNIEAYTDTLLTNGQILEKYTASDNVDGDLSNKIIMEENNYQANYQKVGIHIVKLKVTDNQGRVGRMEINVKVSDRIAPLFSGPTSINKTLTQTLTVTDIKNQLSASDNIDGNITAKITVKTDNYTGNGDKMGTYKITFEVVDLAGNKAEHSVNVSMLDDILPYWIVDNRFHLDTLTNLSLDQIVNVLRQLGKIDTSFRSYKALIDEYTPNLETPGIYAVSLLFTSPNGSENIQNLELKVYEKDEVVDIPKDSGFEQFINWTKEKGIFGLENYKTGLIILGVLILVGSTVVIIRKRK